MLGRVFYRRVTHQIDFARINDNFQLFQFFFDGMKDGRTQSAIFTRFHQVLNDGSLPRLFMNCVFLRSRNKIVSGIWILRTGSNVIVGISTTVFQTEETKTRFAIRHGAIESAASVKINKSLLNKRLSIE